MVIFRAILFAIVCVLATVYSISAQGSSPGKVTGVVRDQFGASIAGARVELAGKHLSSATVVTSDNYGNFAFERVEAGNYRLSISANGFASRVRTLTVPAAGVGGLEISLAVGEARITVTAEIGSEELRENVPQSVNIITTDKLWQRSTSVLAQAAKEEVGLNVQNTSPTIGAIVVRGLTGKNVVNYVDGVRYSNGAQRGGINTFFNLNDSSNLQSIEVLRGPNGAQYGSDSLGGTVNLVTRVPEFGTDESVVHGEFNPGYSSADHSFGSSGFLSYGRNKLGGYVSLYGRRSNTLRTAGGVDSHSAITRFLGLPSTILYDRSTDTAFTQYGGTVRLNYSPTADSQLIFLYQRSQQDGGQRFDQLIGGDGNLIADLRNLMLDFGYLRFVKQGMG